jgi:small GTP-binding protein
MEQTNDNKRKRSDDDMTVLGDPIKIVLLGNSAIGKSTLFHKMTQLTNKNYKFPKAHCATDNFDFDRINLSTNQGIIIIDLWDTAGQENKGGKLRDAYLKGADGILLLYDVKQPLSASNIPKWLEQVKKVSPNIPVAVLGNKSENIETLQQNESVKIRDVNLYRDVGHKKIKNFLVSIKEDTHIETSTGFFSSSIKTVPGCLVGLEYILSTKFGLPIIIS